RRAARRPQRQCVRVAGGVMGEPRGGNRRGVFLDRQRCAGAGGAFGVQPGGGDERGGLVMPFRFAATLEPGGSNGVLVGQPQTDTSPRSAWWLSVVALPQCQ